MANKQKVYPSYEKKDLSTSTFVTSPSSPKSICDRFQIITSARTPFGEQSESRHSSEVTSTIFDSEGKMHASSKINVPISPSDLGMPMLTSQLASNQIENYPALLQANRYSLTKTLQRSLFRVVKLGYDNVTAKQVCVKISVSRFAAAGKSKGGVTVMENVRREAAILRYLTLSNDSKSLADQELGREHVVQYIDELQDELCHYLVTEYIDGGDLFSLLRSLPQPATSRAAGCPSTFEHTIGLSEKMSESLFVQLCRAVQYLHKHHIAHCDLSIENICVDSQGKLTIIDFGLARMHPLSPNLPFLFPKLPPPIVLQQSMSLPITPSTTQPNNLQEKAELESIDECSQFKCIPSSIASNSSQVKTSQEKFVLKLNGRPGKTAYMSGECYAHQQFDLYNNDRYALGVILYTTLTGRPPYFKPSHNDEWYVLIIKGSWMNLNVRQKGVGRFVWSELSESAVELMNGLLKPESLRWKWKEIWNCSWMKRATKRDIQL